MKRALVVFVMTMAAFAVAQEPYHVKQDVLGEPLATYQQNTNECPTAKLKVDAMRKMQLCEGSTSASVFAGAQILKKHVSFLHGRLYLITMTFAHSDFDSLKLALIDKFGPPTRHRTTEKAVLITIAEVMRNEEMNQEQRENVPLSSDTKEWTNGVSTIYLSEHDTTDPTFKTSSVAFILNELSKEVLNNATKSLTESQNKTKSLM